MAHGRGPPTPISTAGCGCTAGCRLPRRGTWRAGPTSAWCCSTTRRAFRDAVPSKLLEYLAAGLAVLATPLPRVAALVDESGAGRLVTGPEQAADCLREWGADPQALVAHQEAARAWADQHLVGHNGYDDLAARLATLVGSVT